MQVLVVGATGATGRWVVQQLVDRNIKVRVVARSEERMRQLVENRLNLAIREATILDFSDEEMDQLVEGCETIISCLGHNLSMKGIWGKPRTLVTMATSRLCEAAKRTNAKTRFILMNTTGNHNRDLKEQYSIAERLLISLFRALVPPQKDNEEAAEYLRSAIGQEHPKIAWVAVRPDGLIDKDVVSTYKVFPTIQRSPLFNAGQTSRINVAHFMTDLATDQQLWQKWQGQMPVIYNLA